jgi:hypothetical protein
MLALSVVWADGHDMATPSKGYEGQLRQLLVTPKAYPEKSIFRQLRISDTIFVSTYVRLMVFYLKT